MEMVHCDFNLNQNGTTTCFYWTVFLLIIEYFYDLQTNKNGLDTPTSNQHPSISTFREVLHFHQLALLFRSTWRG